VSLHVEASESGDDGRECETGCANVRPSENDVDDHGGNECESQIDSDCIHENDCGGGGDLGNGDGDGHGSENDCGNGRGSENDHDNGHESENGCESSHGSDNDYDGDRENESENGLHHRKLLYDAAWMCLCGVYGSCHRHHLLHCPVGDCRLVTSCPASHCDSLTAFRYHRPKAPCTRYASCLQRHPF